MGVAIGDRRWKEYRWRKRKRGWLAESEEHAARGDEITIYRVVNFKCATEKKYNNQSGGECHRLAVLVTGVHSGRGPLPSEVEAYVESQKKETTINCAGVYGACPSEVEASAESWVRA
jgi:hypothetical protein